MRIYSYKDRWKDFKTPKRRVFITQKGKEVPTIDYNSIAIPLFKLHGKIE